MGVDYKIFHPRNQVRTILAEATKDRRVQREGKNKQSSEKKKRLYYKKNRKLLALKGTQQTRLDRHLGRCYQEDVRGRDDIDQLCGREHVRVFFQNPRGVMKGNKVGSGVVANPMDTLALCQLRDLQVDIVYLAEINVNWNNKEVRAKWILEVKKVWRGSRVFGASIKDGDTGSVKNFGGVCVVVTDRIAPYIESVRSSTQGNYVSVTLRGQQWKRTTLICAYWKKPGSASSGNATVWRQQRNQQILETDNPDTLIDPRVECLLELEK